MPNKKKKKKGMRFVFEIDFNPVWEANGDGSWTFIVEECSDNIELEGDEICLITVGDDGFFYISVGEVDFLTTKLRGVNGAKFATLEEAYEAVEDCFRN